jgi:hypothetical protein
MKNKNEGVYWEERGEENYGKAEEYKREEEKKEEEQNEK